MALDPNKRILDCTVGEFEYLLEQQNARLLYVLADKITRQEAVALLGVTDIHFSRLVGDPLTVYKVDGKVRFSREQVLEYRDKKGRKVKRIER